MKDLGVGAVVDRNNEHAIAHGAAGQRMVQVDPHLIELEAGLIIEFATEDDKTLPGTILDFDEVEVRVDLNHPLAGRTVRYSVHIVSVDNDTRNKTVH